MASKNEYRVRVNLHFEASALLSQGSKGGICPQFNEKKNSVLLDIFIVFDT